MYKLCLQSIVGRGSILVLFYPSSNCQFVFRLGTIAVFLAFVFSICCALPAVYHVCIHMTARMWAYYETSLCFILILCEFIIYHHPPPPPLHHFPIPPSLGLVPLRSLRHGESSTTTCWYYYYYCPYDASSCSWHNVALGSIGTGNNPTLWHGLAANMFSDYSQPSMCSPHD